MEDANNKTNLPLPPKKESIFTYLIKCHIISKNKKCNENVKKEIEVKNIHASTFLIYNFMKFLKCVF